MNTSTFPTEEGDHNAHRVDERITMLMQQAAVRVIHGANDGLFSVAGKSVAAVRRSLRTAFNIPDDAQALINGVQVDGDHRLRPGTLEFVRLWGRKASDNGRDEYFVRSGDVHLKLNEILFRLNRLEECLSQVIKQQAPAKDFYTVEEFGKLVDLAPYTVREHCRLQRLRAEKSEGGRGNVPEWRIPHAELVRYRNHGLLPLRKHGGYSISGN